MLSSNHLGSEKQASRQSPGLQLFLLSIRKYSGVLNYQLLRWEEKKKRSMNLTRLLAAVLLSVSFVSLKLCWCQAKRPLILWSSHHIFRCAHSRGKFKGMIISESHFLNGTDTLYNATAQHPLKILAALTNFGEDSRIQKHFYQSSQSVKCTSSAEGQNSPWKTQEGTKEQALTKQCRALEIWGKQQLPNLHYNPKSQVSFLHSHYLGCTVTVNMSEPTPQVVKQGQGLHLWQVKK